MKVLKNNFNVSQYDYNPIETYPKKFVCGKCNSELEYEKEDVRIAEYGCAVVDCPLCGYENYLEEIVLCVAMKIILRKKTALT